MDYIEAPSNHRVPGNLNLFIAGGITGCSDWQAELVKSLSDIHGLSIYNPRRASYSDGVAYEQIEWEYYWLKQADIISFWFAKETIQPITLLEFGRWSALAKQTGKKLIVGCDEYYQRYLDVAVQYGLECPNEHVHLSLERVSSKIRQHILRKHDASYY